MSSRNLSTAAVAGLALVAVALPGTASAAGQKASVVKNAARQCQVERGTTAESREAFRVKYGANVNGRNAFGRCVVVKVREATAARRAAVRACLVERGRTAESVAAFKAKYGADGNALKGCVVAKLAPPAQS